MPSVAEIYLEQGRRMADAKRRQGESSANLAMNIGNQFGAAVQQIGQHYADAPKRRMNELALGEAEAEAAGRRQAAEQDAAFAQLISTNPDPDPREFLKIYGPQKGTAIAQSFNAFKELQSNKVKDAKKTAGDLATGFKLFTPEMRTNLWPTIRQAAITGGLGDATQIPEQADDAFIDGVIAWSRGEAPKQPEGYTLTPGAQRYGPDGKLIADNPVEVKPEKITYGQPIRMKVKGATTTLRPGSDGFMYSMTGKKIEEDDIDLPEPQTGGGQPRSLTPNAESTLIGRLANQWTTATKPARELDRQVSIMKEGMKAVERGDLAQGGQAVLVTFQKILDPTSVVRESEFDRSREGLSLMQRAEAAVERLSNGGAGVPLDELKKYAALAEQIAKAQRDSRLTAIKERLGRNADRYNIPRELVFEEELPVGNTAPVVPDFVWDAKAGKLVPNPAKKGGG